MRHSASSAGLEIIQNWKEWLVCQMGVLLFGLSDRRNKKDGARFSTVMPGDRVGGNGHRLEYRKFYFSIRSSISFLTVGMMKHWNRLHTEIVAFPSLEIPKPDGTHLRATCCI